MRYRLPQVDIDKAKVERAIREHPDRRLTKGRLADRLGIDPTLFSHYLAGRRRMPIDQAVRLADWLREPLTGITDSECQPCPTCGQYPVEDAA